MSAGDSIIFVYEDEHLYVVKKSPNVHSVGQKGDKDSSSLGQIIFKILKNTELDPLEGGLINRLDFETSGLMIGAKNLKTYNALRAMIQAGEIEKRYFALVEGAVRDNALVEGWIGPRHRGSKKVSFWKNKPKGVRALQASTTIIPRKMLQSVDRTVATLVEVEAHIARRHQVRVSCAHIGAPLVGDALYGATTKLNGWIKELGITGEVPAFFLHAASVKFSHPITGAVVAVGAESVEL